MQFGKKTEFPPLKNRLCCIIISGVYNEKKLCCKNTNSQFEECCAQLQQQYMR